MDLATALTVWTTYDLRRDPYPAYDVLRAHGPVHQATPVGPDTVPTWFVVGYDEARQALAHPGLVRDVRKLPAEDRPREPLEAMGLHHTVICVDPPEHTRLRKLIQHAFTPARVNQLRPAIEQIAETLLEQMAHRQEVDLVDAYAFPLPVTVICELLGVPMQQRDLFRGWVKDLFAPAGEHATVIAAGRNLAEYFTALIADKRTQPGDDLISALITARDADRRLTEEELLSTVTLLLVAGHETTVDLIGAGAVALLTHPDQAATVRANPALIASAVEEILRFDGPAELAMVRFAVEPIALGSTTIPAGANVMVALGAANRDPRHVTDPHRLDVHRSQPRHLAFGHGIHHCVGAALARIEAQVALGKLLQRYPRMRLAVPAQDLTVLPNLSLRSYANVLVQVDPADELDHLTESAENRTPPDPRIPHIPQNRL